MNNIATHSPVLTFRPPLVSEVPIMNGMHCDTYWAYNFGDDWFSWSFSYELPPTPTIAQLTMCQLFEFQDNTAVDLGFTHQEWIDGNGVQRHQDWNVSTDATPKLLVTTGLVRLDGAISVWGCQSQLIFNAFFWDQVF